MGPQERGSSNDPATKPGGDNAPGDAEDSPMKPPGAAAAHSGGGSQAHAAAQPKLPHGLRLLDEDPTPKETRLGDSDVNPLDNIKKGGKGDDDGVADGGTASTLDPMG
jgi:hypothetical protein